MSIKGKAYVLFIGFFCFYFQFSSAQNQKLADSLVSVYQSGEYEDELQLLRSISEYSGDPDQGLYYSNLLISKASQANNNQFLHSGYLQKGNHLQSVGDNPKALEAYFKSKDFAILAGDQVGEGAILISIADTYSEMDNHKNAKSYYQKGINIIRNTNDSIVLATALLNAGDEYFNTRDFDSALVYFEESGQIFNQLNYKIGVAYNNGNLGMVYAQQGKDALAEEKMNMAIEILEELEDYSPISVYLTYMADIYLRKNDLNVAFQYSNKSLALVEKYGFKDQISEAHLKLAELNKKVGNFKEAYLHYENHIAYRDSLNNIEAVQEMARIRTDNEVAQKQAEVDLMAQKEKTQNAIILATVIGFVLIGILAIGLLRRNKFISKTKSIIEKERNRSDQLLKNILPADTARELRDTGKVKSQRFDSVSVLFADFVGFTGYAERLTPEEVVDSVDFYFSKFDEIVETYGLEKIKTLGDCYMCAGGLPFPAKDHAEKIVFAAFEMLEFVKTFKAKSEMENDNIVFDIKVGINSGPVVAGVVGTKKFAYDIWGDTVNIASRMESNSEPGKINISESTCDLISQNFECVYRGELEVKNKGVMKMYYVTENKKSERIVHSDISINANSDKF
ncbi:adenylate/guanylate cyclase domain-containing protein [Christiangramia sediminis]|uniref:Tetratricopeptide repeat protein n=1 Tax=Christiangramia sediminis TaxID=2881336 RepID=A0A9X1LGX1_9FLAO|nr:adenylate/guanylate cyclase domain-containing protein [Christiangramia sediminis]MCB7480150.1 tetratricopeptide repeat protein [Christiangramia sediminis]